MQNYTKQENSICTSEGFPTQGNDREHNESSLDSKLSEPMIVINAQPRTNDSQLQFNESDMEEKLSITPVDVDRSLEVLQQQTRQGEDDILSRTVLAQVSKQGLVQLQQTYNEVTPTQGRESNLQFPSSQEVVNDLNIIDKNSSYLASINRFQKKSNHQDKTKKTAISQIL